MTGIGRPDEKRSSEAPQPAELHDDSASEKTVPTSELAGGYAAYACNVEEWTRVRDDHYEGVDEAGRKVVRAYGFRNAYREVFMIQARWKVTESACARSCIFLLALSAKVLQALGR